MAYAKGTKTSIETSENQIRTMLRKAGASKMAFAEEESRALVFFHLSERAIKFVLPLPSRKDTAFTMARVNQHSALQPRNADAADKAWVQATRERYRQLHLCIKAKLESVEQNIESFDDAFLAHVVMPDGQTISEKIGDEMRAQLQGRPLRPLLSGPAQ